MSYSVKEILYFFYHRLPNYIWGKYVRHNLIKVHWGKNLNNFGDCLQPATLKHYGLTPYYVTTIGKADIVLAGTILQSVPSDYSGYIVGTGGYQKSYEFPFAKVLAVRGSLTKNRFPNNSNIALGDTGLLMPLVFPKVEKKRYKLGIVLHFVDSEALFVTKWRKSFGSEVLFIGTLDTPDSVISKIKQCENILSSSLHGLIIADAFHIPNARFVCGETMPSSTYDYNKFDDYYSSLGIASSYIDVTGEESILQLIKYATLKPTDRIDKLISELDVIMKDIAFQFRKK